MNRQLRRMACLAAFLIIGSLTPANETTNQGATKKDPPKKGQTPNYYPTQIGNEWLYRRTVAGNESDFKITIAKTEAFDKVQWVLLADHLKGKLVDREHVRQDEKGVYFHNFNSGSKVTPPIMVLKYPIKPGTTWGGMFAINREQKGSYLAESSEETIDVPAGKFQTVRVEMKVELAGGKHKVNYWFSENVGMVKQSWDLVLNPNPITVELKEYTLKKAGAKKK